MHYRSIPNERLKGTDYYYMVTILLSYCNKCSFIVDQDISSQIAFINEINMENQSSVISKKNAAIHPDTGTCLNGEIIIYCKITKYIKSHLLQNKSFDVWNNDYLPGELCFYCNDTFVLGFISHEKVIMINGSIDVGRDIIIHIDV